MGLQETVATEGGGGAEGEAGCRLEDWGSSIT